VVDNGWVVPAVGARVIGRRPEGRGAWEGEGEEQGGPPASRIMPTRGRLAAGIDAGGRRSEGKGEVGAWRSSATSR